MSMDIDEDPILEEAEENGMTENMEQQRSQIDVEDHIPTSQKESVPLVNEEGIRLDGRKVDELREPIIILSGVLKRADGSAFIQHGNNKILVAVHGPREIHPKHLALPDRAVLRCEYRLATFSVQERKSPAPKRREIELSKVITEALEPVVFLEKFPRGAIDVYILVLDADGGTRCASITAAAVALADAGIPMKGLVTAVAAGKAGGRILLDLSDIEDKEGEGDLPLAMVVNTGEITLCQLDGEFTPDEVKEAMKMAMDACKIIYEKQRQALIHRYEEIKKYVLSEGLELETETLVGPGDLVEAEEEAVTEGEEE